MDIVSFGFFLKAARWRYTILAVVTIVKNATAKKEIYAFMRVRFMTDILKDVHTYFSIDHNKKPSHCCEGFW